MAAYPIFGPLPEQNDLFDRSALPDYISVVDENGQISGYVRSSFLFPNTSSGPKSPDEAARWSGKIAPWDVTELYDASETVIGKLILGVGVVRNGQTGPDVGSARPPDGTILTAGTHRQDDPPVAG